MNADRTPDPVPIDSPAVGPTGAAALRSCDEAGILVVRRGPGANCSSIGSAVEMLFLSAAIGTTVLAIIAAAIRPHVAGSVDAHAGEPPPPAPGPPAGPDEPTDPTEAG